jgi:di/tricarboxylate transporter
VSAEAWFTLAVTVAMVVVMARGLAPPSASLFGAAVALLVVGVTEPGEALSGFSNPAPFTVAALLVVARAVNETGALAPAVGAMLGDGRRFLRSGLRLLLPTAAASAFLSNTSIVAMLTPAVMHWSDREGTTASRYLMPLSFAAVLGGTITVLGTSTNVAVSGLLENAEMDAIGLFEVAKLGLPLTAVGLVLLILLAPRVLPVRSGPRSSLEAASEGYTVEMVVEPGGPLDGSEVESGGLRSLSGVYLVQIERGDRTVAPVPPTTVLRGDDVLRFVGRADDVVDLQAIDGLRSSEDGQVAQLRGDASAIYEVVLGPSSPVLGTTIRDAEFRGRYQAAVVAVHRAGQRINAKLGDVRMRIGDTLLVISGEDFESRWGTSGDFLLVSGIDDIVRRRPQRRALIVAPIAGALVLLAATGVTSILEASLLAALALVALGVLTPNQARNAVDLEVVITIASAFGLAAGMQQSGLADELATWLVEGFDGLGSRGVLLGIVLATLVLTELVTNSAAAVLMFPIALAAAGASGLDPRGTAIAVAVAASASFLTPIGYQTNIMVYGPGGYRFLDYARLGAPLTAAVVVVVVLATPELW